jgi:nitrogen regulatory protein P-II 1
MKRIEAIIRTDKVGGVFDALKKIGHPDAVVSSIKSHGDRDGMDLSLRGSTFHVDLVTKARVEVIAEETETDAIVDAIRTATYAGGTGDGIILIHPLDAAVIVSGSIRGDCAALP